MPRGSLALSLLACCVALAGCAESSDTGTVRATGVVTFDGKPLAGANVTFFPAAAGNSGLASQALTDNEGRFELGTYAGGGKFKPGIALGQYAVVVTKLDTAAIRNTLSPPKNLLPRKYASQQTSMLTADVNADRENDFSFALSPE